MPIVSKAFASGYTALVLCFVLLVWIVMANGHIYSPIAPIIGYVVLGTGLIVLVGAQFVVVAKWGTLEQQRQLSRLGCAVLATFLFTMVVGGMLTIM